ncbi:MAG: AraC family transcriptional regulator ligand-binding domain-containing protein [Pseudomonadota bacterium]
MNSLDNAAPARYFAQLVDMVEATGMPCRDALSAAQIRSLNDPQALLTAAQIDALLAELVRLTGRRDLAYDLGKLIKLTSHDVLGYALISSPTLDDLLRLVTRYCRLMTPLLNFRYQRRGNVAEIAFMPVQGMTERTLHFHYELVAVSFHVQLLAVTKGKFTCSYALSMPEPKHATRYREFLPTRFQFGEQASAGVHIKLTTDQFDVPMAMTDLRSLEQAEARCKQMMLKCSAGGLWSDWVRMLLMEAVDCQPTVDKLASIVNVSARTLDRHLAREGASFRELGVSIRNDRACQMLRDGGLAVSQIAYRLGYTDVANFSRSFKQRNGMSPSAYASLQQQACARS